ncbi:MAG: hypothetical protein ACR2NX_06915 [Chthoniobacterales bacterium]
MIEEAKGRPVAEDELESENPHRSGTAPHFVYGMTFFRKSHCFPTQIDTDLPARSEHSPGGAQRSEQYLDGAQRAIKLSPGLLARDSSGVDKEIQQPGFLPDASRYGIIVDITLSRTA